MDKENKITSYALTDVGRVRKHNEDAFCIHDDIGLFVVSDGMGGHQAGEVAAEIVVKALPVQVSSAMKSTIAMNENGIVEILKQSIINLNRHVYQKTSETPNLRGAGATVVACLVHDNITAIAHMGDSRVYLMRRGNLDQLTEDHSVVAMLMRLGQITAKEASNHPSRHTLTRHVGMESSIGPDVQMLNLQDGDRLLLCTDGLTNMVNDKNIGDILWNEPDIKVACERLITAANETGGKDNITVLIIQKNISGEEFSRKRRTVSVRRIIRKSARRKDKSYEGNMS